MKQAKVLTDKEFKRALLVAGNMRHGARNKLVLMLSHYAGLRVGEIAHLKMQDVRGADGAIVDQLDLQASYTKGARHRSVHINPKLSRALDGYMQSLSSQFNGVNLTRRLSPDAPLIGSQKRRHFSANTLCQLMNEIYDMAGLRGATSHSGRRGFITKLAHAGVSPKVIMELAGHQQLTTTQRYIEVTDKLKKAAVQLL